MRATTDLVLHLLAIAKYLHLLQISSSGDVISSRIIAFLLHLFQNEPFDDK